MALTKQQKEAIVKEVAGRLEGATTIYLTNASGMSVSQVNDLRGRFRASGVGFQVVKNTLLRRAMDGVGGFEGLYGHLEGPTAVAYSEEPAAPARVIKKFVEQTNATLPTLKVAYVDGALYDGATIDMLAALKSKDELIGDILGLLMAPIANVIGGLQAQGGNIVGALKTIAERGEA
jgi:large subunit ribosomal protein L10